MFVDLILGRNSIFMIFSFEGNFIAKLFRSTMGVPLCLSYLLFGIYSLVSILFLWRFSPLGFCFKWGGMLQMPLPL
jgi:membrane protein implicated in regulation of membrane protease activity